MDYGQSIVGSSKAKDLVMKISRQGGYWPFSLCIMFFSLSCTKHLVTLSVVSMTKDTPPEKTRNLGPVNREFCDSDTPQLPTKDGDPALIDEAILKAQRSIHADYLQNAKVTISGLIEECVAVEATGLQSY